MTNRPADRTQISESAAHCITSLCNHCAQHIDRDSANGLSKYDILLILPSVHGPQFFRDSIFGDQMRVRGSGDVYMRFAMLMDVHSTKVRILPIVCHNIRDEQFIISEE